MIVLGLDTSTSATAVAVRLDDGSTSELRDDPPAGAHPGHATRLLGMAHELLAGAGVGWSALERIAVGVGPGTFTGLRVGVASARGLGQGLGIDVVGVSSLGALAAGALDAHAASDTIVSVIDARRGEVFAAAYERADDGLPRELSPPRALPPGDLGAVLSETGTGRPALVVGDGAVRFRERIGQLAVEIPPDGADVHLVSASWICELGSRVSSLEPVVPDYRRRPDAELALEAGRPHR